MVRSSRSKWAGVLSMGQNLIGGQRARPKNFDCFYFIYMYNVLSWYGEEFCFVWFGWALIRRKG